MTRGPRRSCPHRRHSPCFAAAVRRPRAVLLARARSRGRTPSLEGLEKCSKCHQEQKGLSAKLCLDCHTELAGPGREGRRLSRAAAPRQARRRARAATPITAASTSRWSTGRGRATSSITSSTGWPLKGAHAKTQLRRLPPARADRRRLDPPDARQAAQADDVPRPRRSAATPATSTSTAASSAANARSATTRRPGSRRRRFNHQTTALPAARASTRTSPAPSATRTSTTSTSSPNAFPKPRAASFMEMKPIDHKTCESCHDDPHKGSLGPPARAATRRPAGRSSRPTRARTPAFHDKTKFPLRGGHIGVACRSCHGPFPGQPAKFKGLAFARLQRLPRGRAPRPAPPQAARQGRRLRLVPHRQRLRPRALRAGAAREHEVPARGRARARRPAAAATRSTTGWRRAITAAVHKMLQARKRPERFSLAVLHPKKSPQACARVPRGRPPRSVRRRRRQERLRRLSPDDVVLRSDVRPRQGQPLSAHRQAREDGLRRLPQDRDAPARARRRSSATSRSRSACGSCHADVHQGQFLRGRGARAGRAGAATSARRVTATSATRRSTSRRRSSITTIAASRRSRSTGSTRRCSARAATRRSGSPMASRPSATGRVPRACEDCHVDFHHGAFQGFEP